MPRQQILSKNDGSDFVAEVPGSWFAAAAGADELDDGKAHDFNIADAMAASGDYFVTLATRLDKLAQGMPRDSTEQIELEHQVQLLFYMQDHYDLIAKYKRR